MRPSASKARKLRTLRHWSRRKRQKSNDTRKWCMACKALKLNRQVLRRLRMRLLIQSSRSSGKATMQRSLDLRTSYPMRQKWNTPVGKRKLNYRRRNLPSSQRRISLKNKLNRRNPKVPITTPHSNRKEMLKRARRMIERSVKSTSRGWRMSSSQWVRLSSRRTENWCLKTC